MASPVQILKQYWGFNSFRPMQEDIIHSVMNGKDVLALMPTGGGKSICFQVPALAMEGLCLVVSPLIALMKDQVENLRRKNITAFALYSGMTRKELINTLRVAGESNCKFLYVSPERLETAIFLEYLPSLNIRLIAVDEAHCISQWGYDFRPPYLRIATVREELKNVPVLALTATATPEIQKDICDKLRFKDPAIYRQSFFRGNLSFSVFQVDAKLNKILEILQKVPGSAIVYCKTRKHTRDISELLNMHGISSAFYHAGLAQTDRSARQQDWIENRIRVIVCTNAFGMGIDKPNVRTVIHHDFPECMESYYQEAGRAGRDGEKAYAVLLYSPGDLEDLKNLPNIRFPDIIKIRSVYQALMNYLQIPAGAGDDLCLDFELHDFVSRFKLNIQEALYSLKALEQENLFTINEQAFLPSKISFTCNKEYLYAFEKEHPDLEPVIKVLLRTYSGIFDQPVMVQEQTIANLLRIDAAALVTDLYRLHSHRVIEYIPRKEKPQIYFAEARVSAADLNINQRNYERRKREFIGRIISMADYIQEDKSCRSQTIARYFGDLQTQACGICDNCLRNNSKPVSRAEFDKIHQQILQWVESDARPAQELLNQFSGIRKEKIWEVIHFLQAENKLSVDENGNIFRGEG